MQPIPKQLQTTMLETVTKVVTEWPYTIKELKGLFKTSIFVDERNLNLASSLKEVGIEGISMKEIEYLHQLYTEPNSTRLVEIKDQATLDNYRTYMKMTFDTARKTAKLGLEKQKALTGPAKNDAREPAKNVVDEAHEQIIRDIFDAQKTNSPLQQPIPQQTQIYGPWPQIVKEWVRDDTLDWLAVHTEAPVNKYTSRDEKVQQIMQRLQNTREIDLLPSLLCQLGEEEAASRLDNKPRRDVRKYRAVLIYNMFNNIAPQTLKHLYMLMGQPANPSTTAAQQFSNLFNHPADDIKKLFSDPMLCLAHVYHQIDPIYAPVGIPAAALRSEVVQPILGKPAAQASTPVRDQVEQAFYDVYLKSDRSDMSFAMLQFAMEDNMDTETVRRIVTYYQAPARIKTGEDLFQWLQRHPNAQGNGQLLCSKAETIEEFLKIYRICRVTKP